MPLLSGSYHLRTVSVPRNSVLFTALITIHSYRRVHLWKHTPSPTHHNLIQSNTMCAVCLPLAAGTESSGPAGVHTPMPPGRSVHMRVPHVTPRYTPMPPGPVCQSTDPCLRIIAVGVIRCAPASSHACVRSPYKRPPGTQCW